MLATVTDGSASVNQGVVSAARPGTPLEDGDVPVGNGTNGRGIDDDGAICVGGRTSKRPELATADVRVLQPLGAWTNVGAEQPKAERISVEERATIVLDASKPHAGMANVRDLGEDPAQTNNVECQGLESSS